MNAQLIRNDFADKVAATKVGTPRSLGELIDAAALAKHRFRTCNCRDDCPHDGAAIDAEAEVRGFLASKLGLTPDQLDALGAIL